MAFENTEDGVVRSLDTVVNEASVGKSSSGRKTEVEVDWSLCCRPSKLE